MIKYIKKNISNALYFVLVTASLWCAVTYNIQRFTCECMAETELFVNAFDYYILNFDCGCD